jgi:hypothetical protein
LTAEIYDLVDDAWSRVVEIHHTAKALKLLRLRGHRNLFWWNSSNLQNACQPEEYFSHVVLAREAFMR